MSAQDLPPAVREQLTRLDQFQQNLQAIMVQKQQVDLELIEIEKATSELIKAKPTDPVYKTSGSILVKVNKTDLSKELYIFVFICLSGNKIFNIEAADRIQIDLFLSSKKRGEIALISSILKYPGLFSPLDFQLSIILFPIWKFLFCFLEDPP